MLYKMISLQNLSTDTYTPKFCFFFCHQDPNYSILYTIFYFKTLNNKNSETKERSRFNLLPYFCNTIFVMYKDYKNKPEEREHGKNKM
jgi:hypothetical protein